jgi:hypothetical protein
MPKSIMDRLGLEITRPYGDLYSFDSRRVKCMGMIKDLVVTLAQIPVKNVLMDVVVAIYPQSMVYYYLDLGEPSSGDPFSWI